MKKTKKALAMIMAAAMAATVFAGCGKEEEQKGSQESA